MSHTSFIVSFKELKCMILGALSFIVCFDNAYLAMNIPFYTKGLFLGRLMMICVLVLIYFFKAVRPGAVSIFSVAVCVHIVLSTIIHKGDHLSAMALLTSPLVIIANLDLFRYSSMLTTRLMKTWKVLFLFVLIIDIVTEILYPNGLYSDRLYSINWFLGYKTARMCYIIPLLVIEVFLNYKTANKLLPSFFIIMGMAIVDVWFSQASGAAITLVCILALSILVINLYRKRFEHIRKMIMFALNQKMFFIVYSIITFLIVIVNYTPVMQYVAGLLEKDATFTSRTDIWSVCVSVFLTSPIIGKGYWNSQDYEAVTLRYGVYGGTNAHNAILTLLMDGGIIAVVLYFLIFFYAMHHSIRITQKEMVLNSIVFATWILGISSSALVFSPYIFMIYGVLYYSNKHDQNIINLITETILSNGG